VYKSFSLIELIFAILIIAILATIAIPKLLNTTSKTSLLKVKSDLLLIQNALSKYKNESILQNSSPILDSLDDGKQLFSNILPKHNFISQQKVNHWEKTSDKNYNFWFSATQSIEFFYDSDNLTFTCNKNNDLCKEVLR
jgi:general secretion pathway protein G